MYLRMDTWTRLCISAILGFCPPEAFENRYRFAFDCSLAKEEPGTAAEDRTTGWDVGFFRDFLLFYSSFVYIDIGVRASTVRVAM